MQSSSSDKMQPSSRGGISAATTAVTKKKAWKFPRVSASAIAYVGVAAVAIVLLGADLFVIEPPIVNDVLRQNSAEVNEKKWRIVQAEATYFTYLAGLTGAVIAALLAFVVLEKTQGNWRLFAKSSLILLLLAIIQITVGYAIRNQWAASQAPLPPPVLEISKWLGPATSLTYVLGVASLALAIILYDIAPRATSHQTTSAPASHPQPPAGSSA